MVLLSVFVGGGVAAIIGVKFKVEIGVDVGLLLVLMSAFVVGVGVVEVVQMLVLGCLRRRVAVGVGRGHVQGLFIMVKVAVVFG